MPLVQCTHGRHKTCLFALCTQLLQVFAEVFAGSEDFQLDNICKERAKLNNRLKITKTNLDNPLIIHKIMLIFANSIFLLLYIILILTRDG